MQTEIVQLDAFSSADRWRRLSTNGPIMDDEGRPSLSERTARTPKQLELAE